MAKYRGSFILVMVLGAVAPFPWMLRLGFDIGEFWNIIATAVIGALVCGFFALTGYGIGNSSGKGGKFIIAFGLVAAFLIFLLSVCLMVTPI